jgi:hypothetical protein
LPYPRLAVRLQTDEQVAKLFFKESLGVSWQHTSNVYNTGGSDDDSGEEVMASATDSKEPNSTMSDAMRTTLRVRFVYDAQHQTVHAREGAA